MDATTFFQVLAGAAEVPTEKFLFTMANGNLVGQLLGDTYTPSNGDGIYGVSGPYNNGVTGFPATNFFFRDASINAALNPLLESFTVVHQMTSLNAGTAFQFVMDGGGGGVPGTPGYSTVMDATNFYAILSDGVLFHFTLWAHGGLVYKDDTFHTIRLTYDRSLTKVGIEVDGVAQTTSSSVTTLDQIGSVSSGNGFGFYGNLANLSDNQVFAGTHYRTDVAIGSITYNI